MKNPYRQLVGLQCAVTGRWLETVFSALNLYIGLLDPRPDLAKPAREVGWGYKWWWS
jgi:hypothetical protein